MFWKTRHHERAVDLATRESVARKSAQRRVSYAHGTVCTFVELGLREQASLPSSPVRSMVCSSDKGVKSRDR